MEDAWMNHVENVFHSVHMEYGMSFNTDTEKLY
jgi:hypothetical protein